ncbi:hypothetical protein EDD21DRAFT_393380 [Dissophora ornata]|nr:hypothetical protein EDD21DRAFT_393380 [Dissophora ornata]
MHARSRPVCLSLSLSLSRPVHSLLPRTNARQQGLPNAQGSAHTSARALLYSRSPCVTKPVNIQAASCAPALSLSLCLSPSHMPAPLTHPSFPLQRCLKLLAVN